MSPVLVDPAVAWPRTLPPALLRKLADGFGSDPSASQADDTESNLDP